MRLTVHTGMTFLGNTILNILTLVPNGSVKRHVCGPWKLNAVNEFLRCKQCLYPGCSGSAVAIRSNTDFSSKRPLTLHAVALNVSALTAAYCMGAESLKVAIQHVVCQRAVGELLDQQTTLAGQIWSTTHSNTFPNPVSSRLPYFLDYFDRVCRPSFT